MKYTSILAKISTAMASAGHKDAECLAFVQRHSAVCAPLGVVAHLTRAVRMLTGQEKSELKQACSGFAAAWRSSYPNRKQLTVKGHIVERHVPEYAEWHGTCGIFGEDGVEGLHPKDTLVRRLVRTMRNPVARHTAHTLHLRALASTPEVIRQKLKRRRRANGAGQAPENPDPWAQAAAAAPAAPAAPGGGL